MSKKANRLIKEKSPYLLQHAYNPVNWYAWSDEAFAKAKEEDKPVFLSIGYSTCHWCHVMEKESFEDPEVAALMNDAFVNIKLDREERPDIDHVYMSVCQLVNGSGGWPLTVIMTPNKLPFLAGTYFPKTGRMNRIGMMELIPRVKEAWLNNREQLLNSADQIYSALLSTPYEGSGEGVEREVLKKCFSHLEERFDNEFGGFGMSPKFPTPQNILFLNRYGYFSESGEAKRMVMKTLKEMIKGGIYDHVGYGFHRYSTDKKWLLPHFEKMLYDQATISYALIEGYEISKDENFKEKVCEIFEYVFRNLTSKEGGFYSAEDADSEGVEGKFYLWKENEIIDVLGEGAEEIISAYNVKEKGNFSDPFKEETDGDNILYLTEIPTTEKKQGIKNKLAQLREARDKRIRPHLDDKILTDWNGLMIASLAKGYKTFGEEKFLRYADNAINFIENKLLTKEGKLLHRYRGGESAFMGTLDDYAFIVFGLIEMYLGTFQKRYIKLALLLNRVMIEDFSDSANGGFYLTPVNAEKVLVRPKEVYDGAIPSGNSVALFNLLRLGYLTGDPTLLETANRMIKNFGGQIMQSPSSYSFFSSALYLYFEKVYEVVVIGESTNPEIERILYYFRSNYLPNVLLNFIELSEKKADIFPFIKDFKVHKDGVSIYVCSDFKCNLPVDSLEKALLLINEK